MSRAVVMDDGVVGRATFPASVDRRRRRPADACAMFAQPCASAALQQPGSKLELTAPDDWHHHLRDGPGLGTTVPAAARQFKRAIIMPNLVPPVTTVELAAAYKARILEALKASGFCFLFARSFHPGMRHVGPVPPRRCRSTAKKRSLSRTDLDQ